MNLQVDMELLDTDRIKFKLNRRFGDEEMLNIEYNSNKFCVIMPKGMFDELFEELEYIKNENKPLQMRLIK